MLLKYTAWVGPSPMWGEQGKGVKRRRRRRRKPARLVDRLHHDSMACKQASTIKAHILRQLACTRQNSSLHNASFTSMQVMLYNHQATMHM